MSETARLLRASYERELREQERADNARLRDVKLATVFCDITQTYKLETISNRKARQKPEPKPQQHNVCGSSRPKVIIDRDIACRRKYKKLFDKARREKEEQVKALMETKGIN